ncbi:hypothetical protein HN51_068152 [Arachis hypogaea]|uniref:uncharacterized protein n=1 Tax=Arachis hypogaea TaxID=3818 RepID=UPI0007AF7CEE|nr:uncharacterized protein LOC107638195 isoform X2 [Arachis ipaensis]XP_025650443.1 uncharacterized protein LOC112744892 [Arachis hypogaea]XP_025697172.1 uncharacterized protein LOC112798178 [Arachis hypogaea]
MAKNVILMLGLLLLAMVVLTPSKIAATRDYPEISSNFKAEISKSNDNEVEGSGEIGGVKLDVPPEKWKRNAGSLDKTEKLPSTEIWERNYGSEGFPPCRVWCCAPWGCSCCKKKPPPSSTVRLLIKNH